MDFDELKRTVYNSFSITSISKYSEKNLNEKYAKTNSIAIDSIGKQNEFYTKEEENTPSLSNAKKTDSLCNKDEEKNLRYNKESLLKDLVFKYGNEKVKEAISSLMSNSGSYETTIDKNTSNCKITYGNSTDGRFNNNDLEEMLESLKGIKDSVNAKIYSFFIGIFNKEHKNSDKNLKKIQDHLVGLVKREPVSIEVSIENDTTSSNLTFQQKQGHVKDNLFVVGPAISAELQKNEKGVNILANQGFYTIKRDDGSEEVIGTRSARSDTPDKVTDKSEGDILARFETSKEGDSVLRNEGSNYTYRRADITLMDANLIKAVGTTGQSLFSPGKPIENERKFL